MAALPNSHDYFQAFNPFTEPSYMFFVLPSSLPAIYFFLATGSISLLLKNLLRLWLFSPSAASAPTRVGTCGFKAEFRQVWAGEKVRRLSV